MESQNQSDVEELTIDIMHAPVSKLLHRDKKIGQFIKLWHTQTIADHLYKLGYRKSTAAPEQKLNIEELSADIHKIYCNQYKKNKGDDYWTKGDYSLLNESTKDYDRAIAEFINNKFGTPQCNCKDDILDRAINQEDILDIILDSKETIKTKDFGEITHIPFNKFKSLSINLYNSLMDINNE